MTALAANVNTLLIEPAPDRVQHHVASIPVKGERYVFVDALRGVAAILVLLRHLFTSTPLYFALGKILPLPLQTLCYDGLWGVNIFFVLSGFVIAHSLRNVVISPRSIGRFILRRQLRLDPLYWFIILLSFTLLLARHILSTRHGGVVDWGMPGAGDVLTNLFYLHNILGRTQIVSVSWTLCIEVQFYLFYIFCIATGQFVARRMTGRPPENNLSMISVLLVVSVGLASMTVLNLSKRHPLSGEWSPWFTSYWYYFAAGAMACWAAQSRVKPWVFGTFAALFIFCAAYWRSGAMATGAVTASLLFLVGVAGHLGDWLNYRILQYLGRISYSLYMVHLFVVFFVMNGGFKLTHDNGPFAIVWVVVAAGLSVLAAQLTYMLIEKPSLRFSERFKERRQKPAGPATLDSAAAGEAAIAPSGLVAVSP